MAIILYFHEVEGNSTAASFDDMAYWFYQMQTDSQEMIKHVQVVHTRPFLSSQAAWAQG